MRFYPSRARRSSCWSTCPPPVSAGYEGPRDGPRLDATAWWEPPGFVDAVLRWGDEQGVGTLACNRGKGRLDLASGAGVDNLNLNPDRAGGFRNASQRRLRARDIAWIDQHHDTSGLGHELTQQPQPLGHDLGGQEIDARRVAARPGKAGDQTVPDRVAGDAERDRDGRGRSLGRKRRRIAARGDDRYATVDEVGHERRQPIELAAEPVILDDHVLAFDVADFAEPFAERRCKARGPVE